MNRRKQQGHAVNRTEPYMRLDKYIADTGIASRKEASRAAKKGLVTLDGKTVTDLSRHIDENTATVTYCGKTVGWKKYEYVMLNKPEGYISSTEKSDRTVMTLLPPEFTKMDMFPCGRLDIDTVGLLLITNDGPLAHKLLSPAHHAHKVYRYRVSPPIDESAAERIRSGVDIGGYITKPALLEMKNGEEGLITLTEGKFHQIKRTFEAVGSKITYLERVSFGGIDLDPSLERGEWRYLTAEETELLRRWGENN